VSSAINETSTRVIFESACFDATAVRLTAQRLGIRTDASTRFEKSLDPHLSREALPRVLDYLTFLGKNPEIRGYFGH
jgi:phenylalanyl-tRNA synthetase beta chain